jgi:hypothetical protein
LSPFTRAKDNQFNVSGWEKIIRFYLCVASKQLPRRNNYFNSSDNWPLGKIRAGTMPKVGAGLPYERKHRKEKD